MMVMVSPPGLPAITLESSPLFATEASVTLLRILLCSSVNCTFAPPFSILIRMREHAVTKDGRSVTRATQKGRHTYDSHPTLFPDHHGSFDRDNCQQLRRLCSDQSIEYPERPLQCPRQHTHLGPVQQPGR